MSYVPAQNWKTIFDYDFTTQTTTTLATDTTYTIGGAIWTKINSANDATAMVITNGTGLVQKPTSNSNYDFSTRTLPALTLPLSQIIPNINLGTKIRFWGYLASQNVSADFDSACMVIESGSSQAIAYLSQPAQFASHAEIQQFMSINNSRSAISNETGNLSDNVWVLEIELGSPYMTSYSGTYSSGWPNFSSLRKRDSILFAVNVINTHVLNTSPFNILLGAGRAGSGTSLNITWGATRIDYKL